jgi:hypothetical protein
MNEHNEWKLKTYPLSYDPVKDMLQDGFIYGAGRDTKFRPVIVINCAKILAHGATKADEMIAACTYFMDQVTTTYMIPGKIENWVTIFDMEDVGAMKVTNKNI